MWEVLISDAACSVFGKLKSLLHVVSTALSFSTTPKRFLQVCRTVGIIQVRFVRDTQAIPYINIMREFGRTTCTMSQN